MRRTEALAALLALAAGPAAGDMAYVTNQSSSDLSVIDLSAGVETARIPVPGQPAGVHVTADAIYTVSPESKEVRRFTREGVEAAKAVLDGGPMGIAVDAGRGRAFVSDWYNARLWVLDADTLAMTGTLPVRAAPAGIALSPDGRFLAAAERDADGVAIFDAATLEPLHATTVGIRPFAVSFSPDGRLFTADVGSDSLTVLDPGSGAVIGRVPTGERPYGVAFARGRGFATNQYADTLTVFDAESLEPLGTIAAGEYPEGIGATSDGRLVVANWFANTISVIDAETLSVVQEIETGDGPRAFGRFVVE